MGKHRKWGKTAAIVAAAVGGVAILGIWGVNTVVSRFSDAERTGIQTAEVSDGTIESTVAGTGTLEYLDPRDITVPSGLEIESVLRGQGRQVTEGEVLATVGRSSCEARTSEIYGQIADVDQKLIELPQDSQTVDVKAPAAGTVTAVNAAGGASVLDSLASSGSLAVISRNGKMGADITIEPPSENSALPGETVLIELPDTTRVSATVRDVHENGFTAELMDSSIGQDLPVTAFSPQNGYIGGGKTEPLETTSVMGPSGTVESVRVSPGDKVKAGDVLFTVRTAGQSAEYVELQQQRTALAKEYDALALIAESGGITAPMSGTIVTCDVSAGQNTSELAAASGSAASGGSLRIPSSAGDVLSMFGAGMSASYRVSSQDVMLSASMTGDEAIPPDEFPSETPVDLPDETQTPQVSTTAPVRTQEPSGTHEPASSQTPSPRAIPRVEVPLIPPIAGLPLQTELCCWPVYTGTVAWDPYDVQAQHETVYTAQVTLTAEDGFYFADDCTASVLGGTPEDTHSDGSTLAFTVIYPETCAQITLPDIDWSAIQDFLDAGGSLDISGLRDLISSGLLPTSGLGFDLSDLTSQIDPSALYGQVDPSVLAGALSGSSLPSVDSSILSGAGSLADTAGVYEPVAYTIAPDHSMKLIIRINQMDILSVSSGMACTVTVDAIPDTEFKGTVESVSQVVSSDGDYTAEIVVPRDDRMRSGMTASATIITSETSDVLTIPLAAVQEDGNRIFVYTGIDSGSGALTDEVEIETGVSNGNEVEVLSGLEAGQVVYYQGNNGLREFMRMMGAGGEEAADPTYVPPDQAIATP